MPTPEEARARAAGAYNAAADHYDDPANTFWDRYGRGTVERLGLLPGERVLDACCGTGASALPAADRVGPSGGVLGVDLAERLLAIARAKAEARGLTWAEFRAADLLDLGLPGGGFDAVVCVFGVFFVPDMAEAIRSLWSHVKSGGRLAVTTWGRDLWEPATSAFWNAVRAVRPDLYRGFQPWDRIDRPETLRALFEEAGVPGVRVEPEHGTHTIATPEAWWATVMGSGFRGTVDRLSPSERERVRDATLAFVRDRAVTSVPSSVLYALARKPG